MFTIRPKVFTQKKCAKKDVTSRFYIYASKFSFLNGAKNLGNGWKIKILFYPIVLGYFHFSSQFALVNDQMAWKFKKNWSEAFGVQFGKIR